MEKYSNYQKNIIKDKKQEEVLFDDGYVSVIKYKNWDIVKEKDMVIVLPYFRDDAFILLRWEDIPTYQLSYKDNPYYRKASNFITVLSGSIEENENPVETIRRELKEEAGLILSPLKNITIDEVLHQSKGSLVKYHICLIEIGYNEYQFVKPTGDGSLSEKLSKTIKIDLSEIDQIITHDLITQYMIQKLKSDYNL